MSFWKRAIVWIKLEVSWFSLVLQRNWIWSLISRFSLLIYEGKKSIDTSLRVGVTLDEVWCLGATHLTYLCLKIMTYRNSLQSSRTKRLSWPKWLGVFPMDIGSEEGKDRERLLMPKKWYISLEAEVNKQGKIVDGCSCLKTF